MMPWREIHEGDYIVVILPFVSVAVSLHFFFFFLSHKSDKRESWDSGSTGQLRL